MVRWRRWVLAGIGVLVLLVGSGAVAYRVFAPQEVLTPPTVPYPEVQVITDERPFSELRAAPLVVDGRIRVYAEQYRVWSDAPVGVRYETTPYWSFRRWPAQVVGVVLATTRGGTLVISQWSDGEIIAIDARRGLISWRDSAPIAESRGYDGRRTGASVVYAPRSLVTATATDRTVLIVTAPRQLIGFDTDTGARLWQRDLVAACEPAVWTGAGLVAVPGCDAPTLTFFDVTTGVAREEWSSPDRDTAPQPGLCERSRTECRVVTVGYETWLLGVDARLTSVPDLERGAQLAGERLIYQTGIGVAARRLTDLDPLWSWQGQGQLISADSAGVYLLTEDRTILELSPATGHLAAVGCAAAPDEDWTLGHIYPTGTGTYLALERVNKGAAPGADDQAYYFGPRPVALVELYPPTKLPQWPGKFAACAPV
jgi:outer membrane protein assembly factor BamB